ncbi:hypothetical protein AUJ68_04215 [Candidatus Woesearchaeota archaeon CG1_02_57_44]|nr:MAG: hypothetical protein AUJ68_04215 [Candidatus Woesearchaeota archaeon CG1_02_57_44]
MAWQGELWLKGHNRHEFERALIATIRACTHGDVTLGRGLIFIDDDTAPLQHISGITHYAIAQRLPKDAGVLADAARQLPLAAGSRFRVTVKRQDKTWMGNTELAVLLGDAIADGTGAVVDLQHYDTNVGLMVADACYLYAGRTQALGGLPLGTQQRVMAIVCDAADEDAALAIMRRGCPLVLAASVSTPRIVERHVGVALERCEPMPEAIAARLGAACVCASPVAYALLEEARQMRAHAPVRADGQATATDGAGRVGKSQHVLVLDPLLG